MIKIIISICAIIVGVFMYRYFHYRNFKKSPVDMRCWWYDENKRKHRGTVEGRTTTPGAYLVFADDGMMWKVFNPKPIYFEL